MQSLQDVEKDRPEETAIVKSSREESDKFAILDVLDEDLIREELAGVNVDELVYQFPMGNKMVTGLTIYGVLAIARLLVDSMANISIEAELPITVEREKDFKSSTRVTYTNKVTRSSVSFWGVKTQSKEIVFKEPNEKGETSKIDTNAEQIAEMKSMRNAFLKIFPPKKSAEFLNQFRAEGKIKSLSKNETEEALAKAKRRGSGSAKPAASAQPPANPGEPKTKEGQSQQKLLALPGYERKTRVAEIAEDHIDDMRKAVANISWYYSSSGDYKNNTAFKAGNPWGWARKDSKDAEGIVTSLDEEGPDSKIIFDDEEIWFDEAADKLWRKKL